MNAEYIGTVAWANEPEQTVVVDTPNGRRPMAISARMARAINRAHIGETITGRARGGQCISVRVRDRTH